MNSFNRSIFVMVLLLLFLVNVVMPGPASAVIGIPGPAGSCNATYPSLPEEIRMNLLSLTDTATRDGIATDARFGFVVEAERMDPSSLKLSIWSDYQRATLLCCEKVVVSSEPARTEDGSFGWTPSNLPISVTANSYGSETGYDEQMITISKTLDMRPGVITISGFAEVYDPEEIARFGLKVDGAEVNFVMSNGKLSFNSPYSGLHSVQLYVYALDVYGDEPNARIDAISIPIN